MRKFLFWATVLSGAAAAYLMLKRGESLGTVVRKTTTNPVGTLISEVKQAI